MQVASSPPKLGGVPASLSEQAGWFRSRMFVDYIHGNHPASLRSAPLLTWRGVFWPHH